MADRILPLPPAPRPSEGGFQRKPSAEADFWAGLFLELSVRVEWLGQALDAVPREDAAASALVRLRTYARALEELHQALHRVQAHRADPHLKPLFALDGPLAAYLSRLYGWCEGIGNDFERMAVALRRRQPTSVVFSHQAVNSSYAQFEALVSAMRRANEVAHEKHGVKDQEAWRAFEERLEELIWATEWVHMTLARAPGD
jgi:alpha-L-fucosidase